MNEIYLRYEKNWPVDYIYRNYIYPRHFISRSTFYDYLGTPYKKELAEIEARRAKEETEKKRQKSLFDDDDF
ncbi:hypothetical protein [Dysgonomonas termitidis]|uniref:Uncharacterized protein n=1 Tax=Dysgonomonas termitidis TaxID=1516126 RepID=A0ABV9KU29_9BACT